MYDIPFSDFPCYMTIIYVAVARRDLNFAQKGKYYGKNYAHKSAQNLRHSVIHSKFLILNLSQTHDFTAAWRPRFFTFAVDHGRAIICQCDKLNPPNCSTGAWLRPGGYPSRWSDWSDSSSEPSRAEPSRADLADGR